jgi:hypothetical protein
MLMLSALPGRAVLTCDVCGEPIDRTGLALFRPPRPGDTRVPIVVAHRRCTSSQACAELVPTYRSFPVTTLLEHLRIDLVHEVGHGGSGGSLHERRQSAHV